MTNKKSDLRPASFRFCKPGFTLIELLVVIVITAILAMVAAPGLISMRQEYEFYDDGQKLLDLISEARSNALANKKCVDGGTKHDSLKWSVLLDKTTAATDLYCQWDDGTPKFKAKKQITEANFERRKFTNLKSLSNEEPPLIDFTNKKVLISYLVGTGQSKIEVETTSLISPGKLNGDYEKDLKVVLKWAKPNTKEFVIICLDSLAGFPRYKASKDLNDLICSAK